MEKTSKVTQVAANGTWESKYGLMYKFEISFENGDSGEYNSKSQDQNKFVEGQEATYTITSRDYNGNTFYTIKPSQPAFNGGGFSGGKKDPETEKRITRMSVLKVAGDMAMADKIPISKLTYMAQILEQYVMTGDDTMAQIYQASQKPKQGNIESNFKEDAIKDIADDLPF
jgi:hypothetical protein